MDFSNGETGVLLTYADHNGRFGSEVTEQVRAHLPAGFDMIDCGDQVLRGHSSLQVWSVKAVPPTQSITEGLLDQR